MTGVQTCALPICMKEAIQTYVAPDLSELNKKMDVLGINVDKTVEYTSTIKNDLKDDIRRLEGVVENVERNTKQSQRETEVAIRDMRNDVRASIKEVESNNKQLEKNMDDKLRKALANPLSNSN